MPIVYCGNYMYVDSCFTTKYFLNQKIKKKIYMIYKTALVVLVAVIAAQAFPFKPIHHNKHDIGAAYPKVNVTLYMESLVR